MEELSLASCVSKLHMNLCIQYKKYIKSKKYKKNEFYYPVSKANVAVFSSWASFERSVRKVTSSLFIQG